MANIEMMYDEEFDIAYIKVNDKPIAYSKEISEERWADYSQDGTLVGLQVFEASVLIPFLNRKEIERQAVPA